jgi:single-stranded-DNA-specific exonuclease
MIKYRLKSNAIKLGVDSYIGEYLLSLGITNTKSFIERPRLEDQEYFGNLDNIYVAIQELYKGFKENKHFFIQVDSDVDGMTSSAIFYGFFKRLFPESKIEYRLHDGKEHGVILNTVPVYADYIIIPDAGSMQFDEQEQLSNLGRTVIILDHHNVQNPPKFDNVILVNNQISQNFKNKNLSGAGVVYKTIQAFNIYYQEEFPQIFQDYADLAALGLIADMMDTKNLDNNYIIYKGLNNIKNPMLKALLAKQEYSLSDSERPNKIDIAFYVAPLINGVIRFGSDFDKAELFRGFIETSIDEEVKTVYAGSERVESFYDYVARVSYNVKERQNREKTKCMNFLSDRIDADGSAENQLLIVKISKDDDITVPSTLTGLVAMDLLKKYKKPVLVLRPRNENGKLVYAGSGRGKANGDFDSLYRFLRESNLCEYVEGHDMAHGVAITEENLPKLIEYANKKLKDIIFDVNDVEVDFIFNENNLNRQMLVEFGTAINIYGNGIPQPKFAFELNIEKSTISFLGKNSNTVKFRVGGIDFIKFNAKDLATQLQTMKTPLVRVTTIGRAQINTWGGNITPQVIMDDVEVEGNVRETNKLF